MFTNLWFQFTVKFDSTQNIFSCLKESVVMNQEKCDFQQVIGWKDRMGHESVHPVNASVVHPTTLPRTLNNLIEK